MDGTLDKVSAIEGYRAEDLKIGDYYYDDGTTSDGGYRIMEDGTTFQYETVPDVTKTCIGFVFAVDHSQYDLSDYSTTGIGQQKCKVYVIALENAGPQCQWGPSGSSAPTIGCYPSHFSRPSDRCMKLGRKNICFMISFLLQDVSGHLRNLHEVKIGGL